MHRVAMVLAILSIALPIWAKPVIFWVSDPVQADDTVLVAGSGFGKDPAVELSALRDGIRGMPDAPIAWPRRPKLTSVDVMQPRDESLKFTIPAGARGNAWLLRVVTQAGDVSNPVRLNTPSPYWSQGDQGLRAASPGGWLRLFGRCVGSKDNAGKAVLRQIKGGTTLSLSPGKATLWETTIDLPADMPVGEWRVFVHNGHGRDLGWSSAGTVTVNAAEKWPDTVYDVHDFGATGLGTFGDALGIDAAIAEAESQGGGIVYLPRGRYRLDRTLTIPRFTVLRGEATELVSIFWPDTEEPYDLVQGTDHFGLENVTLYASNYRHGIVGGLRAPEAGNVFIRRVRMRGVLYRGHLKPEQVDERFRKSLRLSTGGGDTIRLGGPNIEVTDCDLYGSGRAIYILNARGGRVANNRLYNGRWGWYCLTGSDGLAFENNTLTGADLMSTGGGLNCLGSTYSQNVYYAGNTIAKCHGWDREAMTSDAGHGAFYGHITSASGAHMTLAGEPTWRGRERWQNGGVFILHGKGMGQYRQIAAVADDDITVTVDRPWDVMPDGTSLITITMMQRNYLFIGNHFEDAGIALQYYGTSINHVAADNTCTRAGGFYNSGRWYRHYQPSWYCQFLGNQILEGNGYRFGANNATGAGDSFLGTYGLQHGDNPAPLAYCAVHRHNKLHNNGIIRLRGINRERPGLRDAIVEHNYVANANTGIYVDDGCVGVFERGNTFENVVRERYDPQAERERMLARRKALLDQTSPVYHQDFEHQGGPFFPDRSGSGFAAIEVNGSITREPGISRQSGRFDGKAYLTVNDRNMLRFPEVTISAWILPAHAKGRWGIAAKRSRNGASPYVLAIRNGGVTFEGTDTTGQWSYNIISSPTLKAGTWNHVAATCAEGKEIRLFCNGKLVGNKRVKEHLVETEMPLTIGYEAWGGLANNPRESGNFIGLIDEVKMWSRLLDEDEIRNDFEALETAAAEDMERRANRVKQEAEAERKAAENMKALAAGDNWILVAGTDFSQPVPGKEWMTLSGKWTVKEGTLRCTSTSFLACRTPVRAPLRIEYRARSAEPSDLTAFWGTKSDTYKGGYFVGFASNGNTRNKLLRHGEEIAGTDKPVATPGKWHHVIVQIIGGRIELIVDGEPALTHVDKRPVTNANVAGILAWGEGEFDDLRIFRGK
ncbi:MAG: hypothetical protein HN742_36070 [Lentisphaerae bacterium]|jgi:hypothetical protein|nr:hypothetical protein [Lentisphaerota bacterium]MBT4821369.1 hypothetical protein [Lentisphaerota bacterium]MBT5609522.1 hypothetical protein [Lentisphaerota bacterium]MBT7058480.1 hypothetical protein [Lentisphaerota bacterium]MBT7847343.1 hypothetical protein [Lentisphaerota bacterium]